MEYVSYIWGLMFLILLSSLWQAFISLIWRPIKITRFFAEQGVHGPKYNIWSGSIEEIKRMTSDAKNMQMDVDSHNVVSRVHPYYTKWIQQYGGTFLYWYRLEPRLCITDPEKFKQVLSNKFGFFIKPRPNPVVRAMFGKGLVRVEGLDWSRHRRIVNPAFAMDKLKMMTKTMAECTLSMLDNWKLQNQATVEINKQFQELTADVISCSAFGSSYAEGKEVFLAQKQLQILAAKIMNDVNIPMFKYVPTKRNMKKWKLERKVKSVLTSIIQNRMNSDNNTGYGNDLLGLLMEANKEQGIKGMDMEEIIDECKTFFFAGHETTSHLLSWTMFLLSKNLEWQERLREEVMRECGTSVPNADNISKLKQVTMVLFETLRLYPPAFRILRKAVKDMKLGELCVPKGTVISMPIAIIHHSKELWGDDVDKFNPLRFEKGIAKAAKHPNAMMAFSMGPRVCVGQNFAMMEAKLVIAMVLQKFSFTLSPDYKHMPIEIMTLQPQKGLQIVLKPIEV